MTDQNDPMDTEGHKNQKASDDDVEGHRHLGGGGVAQKASDDDVEGHSMLRSASDEDDTEGHKAIERF